MIHIKKCMRYFDEKIINMQNMKHIHKKKAIFLQYSPIIIPKILTMEAITNVLIRSFLLPPKIFLFISLFFYLYNVSILKLKYNHFSFINFI